MMRNGHLCERRINAARSPGASKGGFTLIEMLVVIAITAVLAGFLLPVLARGKAKAQAVICLNNLRQLQTGWLLYTLDNEDRVPYNRVGPRLGESEETPNWVAGWLSWAYETRRELRGDISDNTNIFFLTDDRFGKLGGYIRHHRCYKCPADRSTVNVAGSKSDRVRSYSMNGLVGSRWLRSSGQRDVPRQNVLKFSEMIGPARTWVFIDEHEDSINDGNFHPSPESWHDLPGGRHSKRVAISFADGHVEIHRWLDSRTLKPVERNFWVGNPTPDNPDIVWLWERSPPAPDWQGQ